jgi:hypothetical protein
LSKLDMGHNCPTALSINGNYKYLMEYNIFRFDF